MNFSRDFFLSLILYFLVLVSQSHADQVTEAWYISGSTEGGGFFLGADWNSDGHPGFIVLKETSFEYQGQTYQSFHFNYRDDFDNVTKTVGYGRSFGPSCERLTYGNRNVGVSGDVNGDGKIDFVSGESVNCPDNTTGIYYRVQLSLGPLYNNGSPIAYWYSNESPTVGPVNNSEFGKSVDIIDDINGSGWKDIAVTQAAFNTSSTTQSKVAILEGSTGVEIRSHLYSGNQSSPMMVVKNLGKIDSDSIDDYGVIEALSSNGHLIVYSGSTGNSIYSIPVTLPWLLSLPDVNADGKNDYAIRELDSNGTARIKVMSGANGAQIYTIEAPVKAPVTKPNFGDGLSVIHDVDGDGIKDLALGFTHEENKRDNYKIKVYSALDGKMIAQKIMWKGDSVPIEVLSIPDFNGDGISDLVVSEAKAPAVNPDPTAVPFDNGVVVWTTNGRTKAVKSSELDYTIPDEETDDDFFDVTIPMKWFGFF